MVFAYRKVFKQAVLVQPTTVRIRVRSSERLVEIMMEPVNLFQLCPVNIVHVYGISKPQKTMYVACECV